MSSLLEQEAKKAKEQKEQVVLKKAKAMELAKAFQGVFQTQNGELVLKELKKLASFNSTTVPVDSQGRIDPYEVMRNEGKRAVIVHIEKQLTKTFDSKQERAEI